MSKDSYWFRHDSTSGRGLRIRKIQHIYGHWGKGIYWDVIEVLREQDGYQYNSDDTSLVLLADLIGCRDEDKFLSWFRDCEKEGLFKTKDGIFYSEVLTENMKFWEKQKANGEQGGRPKKNPNKTQTKPKQKAKRKHNIIEHIDIINNVIFLFNKITGKSVRLTEQRKKEINGRLNDGYTEDDFKQVIHTMYHKWKDDPKMKDYITPDTLFRASNFPKYLEMEPEQKRITNPGFDGN